MYHFLDDKESQICLIEERKDSDDVNSTGIYPFDSDVKEFNALAIGLSLNLNAEDSEESLWITSWRRMIYAILGVVPTYLVSWDNDSNT